jgi:hypothetical protein
MKQSRLEAMTVNELVELFAEIGIAQDQALLDDEIGKFNKLFDRMHMVNEELKGRTGDQRRALLRLYNHPNAQVRLKAAKATLAVAPDAARNMLETIANSREFPQAGEAGMSLWNLEQGIFNPS